MWEGNKLFVVK